MTDEFYIFISLLFIALCTAIIFAIIRRPRKITPLNPRVSPAEFYKDDGGIPIGKRYDPLRSGKTPGPNAEDEMERDRR